MRDRWGNSLQALGTPHLAFWSRRPEYKYKRQIQKTNGKCKILLNRFLLTPMSAARGYSVCVLYLYVQTYVLGWVGCPHICLVQHWMGRLYILANIFFEMGMLPSPMFGAAWDGYVVRPWPNSCLLSVWGLSGIGHGTAHTHSAILPCRQHIIPRIKRQQQTS